MMQPPFHVTAIRAGNCLECGRSLDTRPHGVKLRLVGERTLGTILLCRECFARAIAVADRGASSAAAESEKTEQRECRWAAPGSSICGQLATMSARATRKDGSAVADQPLCDEHFAAFKLWWHDYAITVQRLSSSHENAQTPRRRGDQL